MTTYDVVVFIYDLSKGVARAMSPVFLGKQIDGIWHTGIVVYGQEFFFGGTGGIESCPPGGTILGQPDIKHYVGKTHIPYDMFVDYLHDLSQTSYRPEKYHLLDHNCNTFSSEIAQFLTGKDIPSNITGLPAEIMTTPFGQMIRPFIDAMTVQPSGGHAMFPQDTADGASTSRSPSSTLAGANPKLDTPVQDEAQASTAKEEPGEPVFEPYVYRLPIHDLMHIRPEIDLSGKDQNLITDITDYLMQEDLTWSPGRDHLALLRRLIQEKDHRCEQCALDMLTGLAAKPDIIDLLLHDPNCLIQEILKLFDGYTFNRKESVLKLMTNCCSSEKGSKLVLCESAQSLTTKICVSSLLGDNLDLTTVAVALCHNMSIYEIPDDMELEIGSALLNCVDKDFEAETAEELLTAILNMIKKNEEVRGLASVIGLNLESMQNIKSVKVTALCDRINLLL